MRKIVVVMSVMMIAGQSIFGAVNRDFAIDIMNSDIQKVETFLQDKKLVTVADRNAYLAIANRTIDLRYELMFIPLSYKIPTTPSSKLLVRVGFIGALFAAIFFCEVAIAKHLDLIDAIKPFVPSFISLIAFAAADGEDIRNVALHAREKYNDANFIHSLIVTMPVFDDPINIRLLTAAE